MKKKTGACHTKLRFDQWFTYALMREMRVVQLKELTQQPCALIHSFSSLKKGKDIKTQRAVISVLVLVSTNMGWHCFKKGS